MYTEDKTEDPIIVLQIGDDSTNGLSEVDIIALFHEMVHYYAYLHEINDVDWNVYHNKRFKKIVEEHGGICEYENNEIGYSFTLLEGADFLEVVNEINLG